MASSIKKRVNAAPSYRVDLTFVTLDNIAFVTPFTACAGRQVPPLGRIFSWRYAYGYADPPVFKVTPRRRSSARSPCTALRAASIRAYRMRYLIKSLGPL